MWWDLEKAIAEAARRRIRNYEQYRKRVFDENNRRTRRSAGAPSLQSLNRPSLWSLDPGFDPYHVRTRSSSIAHAISMALRAGSYVPRRPAGFYVPKRDGTKRLVSSFQIADEVISARLYRSLLTKNKARLSARSYAYRDDLTVYDAISHIQSEWRQEERVFVAEYDFTDYFGSISHDHLWRTCDQLGLTMTALERQLAAAFIEAPAPYTSLAEKSVKAEARSRGVLQGTSISLFMANVAASPLDRSLERLAVNFARFADDTLIWSRDYDAICRAVEELHNVAGLIGSPINQEKSKGVRILVSPETSQAELPSTPEVDYLSHSIGLRTVRMTAAAEARIRERVAAIIFNNLLREPLRQTQDLDRVITLDRDYVACIWQLRRYLYGRLTENEVRRLQRVSVPMQPLTGAVARFPLTSESDTWAHLDEWIHTQVWLALRKRARLLRPLLFGFNPTPWTLPKKQLLQLKAHSTVTGEEVDLRMPRTQRMARVVGKAVRTHGTSVIGSGLGLYGSKR